MELDCRGMRCPLPIINLAKAIKVDEEIILLSDDPATLPDLTAWARMTGNTFTVIAPDTYKVKRL
jgi:tRNA 2-thiouridine synthesizing protein A